MFSGEHERLLDDKGRLVLPPLIRRELDGDVLFIAKASDPCLVMLTPSEVRVVADRLNERVRAGEATLNHQRRWSASLTEVKVDSQGRVAIPPKLRAAAGLDREVVLIGVVDRAELWSANAWAAVEHATNENAANDAMWLA